LVVLLLLEVYFWLILFYFFFVFIQKKEVKNNKKQKIYKTLGALVLFLIIPIALNKIGILDSISSRNESLEYGNRDVSNGRFDRWISGLEFFKESPILGNGANSVTMHKRARYMDVDSKDLFSPHNTFVLILMERGIVGFFVFLVILFQLIRPIRIRGTSIIKLTILIAVFISMNTEIVYVFIEFSGLLFILWNLSLLEKKELDEKEIFVT
jgi:O-antigen ligase